MLGKDGGGKVFSESLQRFWVGVCPAPLKRKKHFVPMSNNTQVFKGGLLFLGMAVGLFACDLLSEDLLPNTEPNESIIDLPQTSFSVAPGGQLMIDILDGVDAGQAVEISITSLPESGTLELMNGQYLRYVSTSENPTNDQFVFQVAQNAETWDQDTVDIIVTDTAACTDAMLYYCAFASTMDSTLIYYLPTPTEPDSCQPALSAADLDVEVLNEDDIIGELEFDEQTRAFFYEIDPEAGAYHDQIFFEVCGDDIIQCTYGIFEVFVEGDTSSGCITTLNGDFTEIVQSPNDQSPTSHFVGIWELLANDVFCDSITSPTIEVVQGNWNFSGTATGSNDGIEITLDQAYEGAFTIEYLVSTPEWNEPMPSSLIVNAWIEEDSTGGCQDHLISDVLYMVQEDGQQYPSEYSVSVWELTSNDILCDSAFDLGLQIDSEPFDFPGTVSIQNNSLVVSLTGPYQGIDSVVYSITSSSFNSPLQSSLLLVGEIIGDSTGGGDGGNDSCFVSAEDDQLVLDASLFQSDSVMTDSAQQLFFEIEVLNNDVYCQELATSIEILSHPQYGWAFVEGTSIYYVREQNGVIGDDVLTYQLCDGGSCDTATVSILLE